MFKTIKQLFFLLTPQQRKKFYVLQVLIILMALMELVGIASIGPFMALVADPSIVTRNETLSYIYSFLNLKSTNQFLFVTGVMVLVLLALASLISILTTWRLSILGMQTGTEIADRLYEHYLKQNWLFHANSSSAQLTNQIAIETNRVTGNIIIPFLNLNSRIVLASLISISIIVYNPLIAFIGLAMFASGYFIIYKFVKKMVGTYGEQISAASTQRFRLMSEGFGGIKDLLLLGRSQEFIDRFHDNGKILAKAQGTNAAISQVPRYFMELIAFGAMIGLVLVLIKLHNGVLVEVLPVLAVYALAGFKLLPALQQIYGGIVAIKGSTAAFDAIKDDLIASQNQSNKAIQKSEPINLQSHKNIVLDNVSFLYPKQNKPAISQVNLIIPLNTTVGFVGESGSGKSTIIDIILSLIQADSGNLKLDDTIIDEQNQRGWQSNIGFVPQSIFLSEGTIAENIAFGIKKEYINLEQIHKAIKLSHLQELVDSLPGGINTKVGERGVKLSGGQRQRIGIARALYNDASILVFDEATSALDGITEKYIMDAINELSGQRTIILIAHRLKTVQQCDAIFLMEQGKLIDQGSYQELITRNKRFSKMAEFA